MNKDFWKSGDPCVSLTGRTLAFWPLRSRSLTVVISTNAIGYFWPGQLIRVKLKGGEELLGQIVGHEDIPSSQVENDKRPSRTEFQVANRDLYGADFRWVEDAKLVSQETPPNA